MTRTRPLLGALAAVLVLVVSACGGSDGGDVPEGAVAVVDGTEISRAELDELIDRAKTAYEAQKQDFPKAGTPEYQNLQTQYIAFLVQREELEKEATELGVEVTDEDVDKAVADFIKDRFEGKRKEYEKALSDQGFTEEDFRDTLRTSVLSQKIFDEVTKDVDVSDADIAAYYAQNQSQYRSAESRDVRHILISEKDANGEVDYKKSKAEADAVYAQLQGGADFAKLAKQKSDDPGSKDSGGELTIQRGETVAEFDKTAFELDKGEVSKPVRTQFGYHVIEALSETRKAKTTPLDEVRDSIKSTLLQERRNEVMTQWVEDLRKKYESRISYAEGFEPPELPDEPTETE